MFFAKQIFISATMFFGCNLSDVNSLKCVSMNTQECRVRPEIVNVQPSKLATANGSCRGKTVLPRPV